LTKFWASTIAPEGYGHRDVWYLHTIHTPQTISVLCTLYSVCEIPVFFA